MRQNLSIQIEAPWLQVMFSKFQVIMRENADYFPDFDNDIKAHLLQFSNEETSKIINHSNLVDASTNNWKISDLYGSVRVFGGSATFQIIGDKDKTNTAKFNLTPKQSNRIKQLLKVRGRNFGTTSVTITDLKIRRRKLA